MANLINPTTGRSLEQEELIMRLQFWLSGKRVFQIAAKKSGIPGEALAFFSTFATQLTDVARWRFCQMLLNNRFVRRSIVAYEMKQGNLTRAGAKADILRLKSRADEAVRQDFLRP